MKESKTKKPLKNNNAKVQKAKIDATQVEKKVMPKNAYTLLSKIAIIILNLVGFPVLMVLVYQTCKFYDDSGIYTWMVWVPLILTGLFWGLTLLLQFYVFRHDKKKHRSFKHTMLACTAIPLCFLSGLFLVVDIVLPKPFVGATSNTIFYEDMVVDAKGKHEHFVQIAHSFLYKNNLYLYETNEDGTPKYLEETIDPEIDPHFKQYKGTAHEGQPIPKRLQKPVPILDANGEIQYEKFFSDKSQKLFDQMFLSFDSAYKVFNGLAVEYALTESDIVGGMLDGSIPATVMLSIILKTSPNEYELDVKRDLFEILSMNMDTIVAAVKELINTGFDFSTEFNPYTNRDENLALDKVLKTAIVSLEYNNIEWNILQLLGDNPLSNVDPNGDIVMYPGTLQETHIGGCQGYQDMAWLNSIDLLGMVACLLDCRKLFYMFGALIALFTAMIFLLKKRYQVVTGKDLTLLPHNKRDAKDAAKNYFWSNAVNSMAEIDEMEEKEAKPKNHKIETEGKKIEQTAFVAVKESDKTDKKTDKKEEKKSLGKDKKDLFGKDKKDKDKKPEEVKPSEEKKDLFGKDKKSEEVKPTEEKKAEHIIIKPNDETKPEVKVEDKAPAKEEVKVEPIIIPSNKVDEVKPVEPVKPEKLVVPSDDKKEIKVEEPKKEEKVVTPKVEEKTEVKVEIKPNTPPVVPQPKPATPTPRPVGPQPRPVGPRPVGPQPGAPVRRPAARPGAPTPRPAGPARRPAARPGAPTKPVNKK